MSLGFFFLITLLADAVLLVGEKRQNRRIVWVAKPIAALGFLSVALFGGAFSTDYGTLIMIGLFLAAAGDIFLIPKARPWFLAGLVSFLAGHLFYAIAFAYRGIDPTATAIAAAVCALIAVVVGRWLLPHVEAPMKKPVLGYIAVISAMVALAVGTVAAHGMPTIAIGAIGFYLSDLAVARERFVASSFTNKLWGSPLYFLSQLILATTVLPHSQF